MDPMQERLAAHNALKGSGRGRDKEWLHRETGTVYRVGDSVSYLWRNCHGGDEKLHTGVVDEIRKSFLDSELETMYLVLDGLDDRICLSYEFKQSVPADSVKLLRRSEKKEAAKVDSTSPRRAQ